MGILDGLLGPALTVATQAAGSHEQAKQSGSALLRQLGMQQLEQETKRSTLDMNKAHTDLYKAQAAKEPKGSWTVHVTENGLVRVNPATGETEPLTMGGQSVQGPAKAQGHVVDPVTGDVKFFDPTKPPQGMKINPAPKPDHFTPVTVGGETPDSPGVIKPFDTKTGKVGEAVGNAKQTLRIESATNTAAKARLEAAVSEMNNAHKGMEEFETKLRNGTANIHGLEQWAGRAASAFTHDDPVSMAAQSAALAVLNTSNPELARYIRRGLSFAEGESMISQRPSDFRTKMSAFLSQAAAGASPEMIGDIESRRNSILGPLNRTVPPGGKHAAPSAAPASGQPTTAQQLWDAAVAKHGQAKVEQEYGPRPQEEE